MEWSTIYSELKSWQHGIAALLGLLALMAAALFNYRLNRLRDAALRKDEALSIAVGIYSEIVVLREELVRLSKAVANNYFRRHEIDEHFLAAHKLSEPVLFKALAPKIGLLPPHLALAIAEFYQRLQEVVLWLPLLAENKDRRFGYSRMAVLKPVVTGVRNVLPALKVIEVMGALPKVVGELDLKDADEVIEQEEFLHSVNII